MNKEQIKFLNYEQNHGEYHPKTCMSFYCNRGEREDEGILIATENYWICPCGQLKQDYHMSDKDLVKQIEKSGKDLIREEHTISKEEIKSIKSGQKQ